MTEKQINEIADKHAALAACRIVEFLFCQVQLSAEARMDIQNKIQAAVFYGIKEANQISKQHKGAKTK